MPDLVDLTDPTSVIQVAQIASSDEAVRVRLAQPDAGPKLPLARLFAFVVSGGLAPLGVVGLLASLTGHSTLLGVFHVDLPTSAIYVVSGAAGQAVWRTRRESLAVAYAVVLMVLYVVIFSAGNIALGNGAATPVPGEVVLLGLVRLHDIPAIAADGMQITIALLGLITVFAAALQQGARATMRARGQRVVEYRSHTKVRTAAEQ